MEIVIASPGATALGISKIDFPLTSFKPPTYKISTLFLGHVSEPVFCATQTVLSLVPPTMTAPLAGLFERIRQFHKSRVRILSSSTLLLLLLESLLVLLVLSPISSSRKASGKLVLVGNRNRKVAVGVGVTVAVPVAKGVRVGVLVGGNTSIV